MIFRIIRYFIMTFNIRTFSKFILYLLENVCTNFLYYFNNFWISNNKITNYYFSKYTLLFKLIMQNILIRYLISKLILWCGKSILDNHVICFNFNRPIISYRNMISKKFLLWYELQNPITFYTDIIFKIWPITL